MAYYIGAYERVKVPKQEYDAGFGRWLDLCENSSNHKELLVSFREAKMAFEKLNDASWELARILGKTYRIPDDFVVRMPGVILHNVGCVLLCTP